MSDLLYPEALKERLGGLVEWKNLTVEKAGDFLREPEPEASVSAMTRQIFDYVNETLQDDNLTLKYIAKNFLYMNVDYVSKKFLKETGIKFSTYLADVRIKKAKELLVSKGPYTIQEVAGEVGLGNNPQYFSQLFKKKTGMTPSSYVAQIGGKAGK